MTINIQDLSKDIASKGHQWVAEENHITKMDPKARLNMHGAIEPEQEDHDGCDMVAEVAGAPLPTQIDWRNNNGNFVTPVKNQGACGSCVGFGSTAVVESMTAIEHKNELYNMSVADAFFCSNHGQTCSGWWPSLYFSANKTRGVITDYLFPYATAFQNENGHIQPHCKVVANRQDYAVTYSNTNVARTVEATKAYLTNTGPITACFQVYADFYAYKSGIYKHTSGAFEGLHCISIVGFNDNNGDGYWICKNSWGSGWGQAGYFCIAYNQCSIDSYAKVGVSGLTLSGRDSTDALLLTQGNDGIWSFNLGTGNTPGQIPSTGGLGFRNAVRIGNFLYLTTHGNDGIWKYDISTETTPHQISSTGGLGFSNVVALGNTLYLTTQGGDGIWTFDTNTEKTPGQIPSTAGLGFIGVVAKGTTLYLTTQGSDGIWTFDTTTNKTPAQIPTTAGLGFWGLQLVGNKLYLATHGSDGIWTFDTISQQTPGQIPSTAGLGFRDILCEGSWLYLTTHGSDGIWVFDMTTNAKPMQVAGTQGLGFWGFVPK